MGDREGDVLDLPLHVTRHLVEADAHGQVELVVGLGLDGPSSGEDAGAAVGWQQVAPRKKLWNKSMAVQLREKLPGGIEVGAAVVRRGVKEQRRRRRRRILKILKVSR
jgi:hypothetical protein